MIFMIPMPKYNNYYSFDRQYFFQNNIEVEMNLNNVASQFTLKIDSTMTW